MERRTFLAGLGGAGGGLSFWGLGFLAHAQTPVVESDEALTFPLKVAAGAEARTRKAEVYDPAYVRLAYPMGDVADDRGVCTDTVIRAFRHAGVDLQVKVHEDMKAAFGAYPKIWGLTRPDRNIDHRRVPNLETFFTRRGASRTLSREAGDYLAGDVVSWRLTGTGLPHIGVVTRWSRDGKPLVAHNIGAGTQAEPCLFDWPMTGWFRFAHAI